MNLPGTPPREAVVRPDPGLARGLWEAPAWVFYLVAALAIVGAVVWVVAVVRSRRVAR
ncbi:MAG: hypothetical protein ACLP1X_02370 [Polyangiaceae bacterium]